MDKFLGVLVFLVATLSCSRQALQLSTSKGDSIKDPTAGDTSSEISYSGALMIDSIKSEMATMRYSLDQITTVVNAAKTEVSLASNLAIESSQSLSLDGEGKSLRMASIAVAKGAIRALKQTALPEDAGILFQLANSAKPEQLSMATVIKGQTKGMGLVKSRGKIAGMSSVVLAQATSEMASAALSTGAKTGMITSDNAPQMISAIAKSLFGNLKNTSMELDAEKIIPSFSSSLSGLKQINLPKEALILVTQSMISESISGIKANNLESMTEEILPDIITNTIVGTHSASGSSENFASAAAEVGKSALSSVNQLGLIKSKDDGSTFATLVFSSSIKSMDKIPDWNVDQLTNVAVSMQQKAMESAKDLGFSGNDAADILVNATVSIVKSMGSLDRIQDLVVANDTLTQSFNRVTEATTKDLTSSIEGVSKDYSATMQTAVTTAATEGSATSPTTQPTTVPTPTLAIPTLITRVAPTMNRSISSSVSFSIGSAVPGQTIKFFSDSSCSFLLGQGVYTSSAVTIPITLPSPGAYFFYAKSFDANLNFSACANTGETYVLDNSTPAPSATLIPPSGIIGNSNLVTLGVSMLEINATIEIYSDNLCASSLLGSAVATSFSQNLTAVLSTAGMYNFYLKQTDDLGNSSSCVNSGLSYLYDTTPPSMVSLAFITPSVSPSNLNTITLRANGSEANSTIFLYNNSSCISAPLSSRTGVATFTDFTANGFMEGTNLLYAKQVDAAGNASSCSPSLTYFLDSTPPQLPSVTLDAGQASFSSSSNVYLKVDLTETGGTLKIYSNSTCTALQTTLAANSMSMNVVLSAQTEGPHAYYATLSDSLGNTSACSTSFASWTKDSVAPPPPQLNLATSPAGPSASTNITVTGNAEPFSTIQLYSDTGCTMSVSAQSQTAGSGAFSVPFNIPTLNSTYTFFAKAIDQAQNSSGCSTTGASFVHNSNIPSILNVYSSSTSHMTVGGTIDISVAFSESVYVTGSPRLELELGSGLKYANYLSGTGTSVLLFRYIVVSGDNTNDLDYKTASALSTNGGTIRNISPVDALLALPTPGAPNSLGFNQNIRVDTTSPMITDILAQSTLEDIPLSPISYTITDAGSILDCVSSVSVTTSNPSVLPLVNIVKSGQAPNCLLTLASELNSFGASTVTVTINDGLTAPSSDSFLFSVTSVNDSPHISDVTNQSMNEDGIIASLPVVIDDFDNALNCNTSLSATSSNPTLISSTGIVFSGPAPNCNVSLTANPNQNGSATITLTLTDGSEAVYDSFLLNVIPENDPPIISAISSQNMNEDSTLLVNVQLSDIDNNLPCSALTITNSSDSLLLPPTSPHIVIGGVAPNCTLTLNPALNKNGSSTISINAFDGATTSGTVNFTVSVTPVDDPPSIPAIPSLFAILGNTKIFNFPVNDVDSNVDCVYYPPTSSNSAVITSAHMSVTSGGTNICSMTISAMGPSPGNSTITVTVKDATSVVSQSFSINITKQWYQEAYIKAPNSLSTSSINFGRSVSLNDSTLAVGAEFEGNAQSNITPSVSTNTNSMANAGAVYVFGRSGANWSIQSYIKASNNRAGNYFGNEVSLSGDTLAVASYQEGSLQSTITPGLTSNTANGAPSSGAAYIFKRMSGAWSQEAFIKPSNSESQDFFGQSLNLSGNTLLVGATQEDSSDSTPTITPTASTNNTSVQSGAAYLFSRMGANWTQEAYIKASNVGAGDYFGEPVAVSGDTIAIGAWNEANAQNIISNTSSPVSADNSATASGAVYIYRKDHLNQWRQEAFIKASNSEQNDLFSSGLSLSGNMLAVGSPAESSNLTTISYGTAFTNNNSSLNSGAVYIFNSSGSVWSQQAYIKSSNNRASNNFGDQISLSGSTLAVGVKFDDSNQTTITYGAPASTNITMPDSGATFIYKYISGNWHEKNYIKPANTHSADNFGFSVSLSGDSLAVGAPQENSSQTNITNGPLASTNTGSLHSGATYIYRNLDIAANPDLRITAKTSTSITLAWNPNLGSTTQVKVAPASLGDADPQDCNAAGFVNLSPGVAVYTYTGLTPSSRYGFRVCANDGTNTIGSVIWDSTNP